jgi:hypothetical protein
VGRLTRHMQQQVISSSRPKLQPPSASRQRAVLRAGSLERNILGMLDDGAAAAIIVARSDAKVGAPLGNAHACVRHLYDWASKKRHRQKSYHV